MNILPTPALDKVRKFQEAKVRFYSQEDNIRQVKKLLEYFQVESLKDYFRIIRSTPIWELPLNSFENCLKDYTMEFKDGRMIITKVLPVASTERSPEISKTYISISRIKAYYHKCLKEECTGKIKKVAEDLGTTYDEIVFSNLEFQLISFDELMWQYIYEGKVSLAYNNHEIEIKRDLNLNEHQQIGWWTNQKLYNGFYGKLGDPIEGKSITEGKVFVL